MEDNTWEKTIKSIRQKLERVRRNTYTACHEFEELRTQAESLKIITVKHHLDGQRELLSRSRGSKIIMKNRKALNTSLVIATAASLITGILSKDGLVAGEAGLLTLDGAFQEAGRTNWAICLGKRLIVAPRDEITHGEIWVTWESVKEILTELEVEASQGALLGNLDNIISRVKDSARIIIPSKRVVKLKEPISLARPKHPTE